MDIESDGLSFLAEISNDEEIDSQYLGDVYLKGEKVNPENISYYYDIDEDIETVYLTYYFTPSNKKEPAAKFLPLKLKSTKQGKKSITLNWKKKEGIFLCDLWSN